MLNLEDDELVALSILLTEFDREGGSAAEELPKDPAKAHEALLHDIRASSLYGALLRATRKVQSAYGEYEKRMEGGT